MPRRLQSGDGAQQPLVLPPGDDQEGPCRTLRGCRSVSTLSSHRDRDARSGPGAAQAQEQPRLRSVTVADRRVRKI